MARFRRGRQLAAWLGLPPKEHSSGSRRRLGAMSKRGDPALRTLLIHGGRSCLAAAERLMAGNPDPEYDGPMYVYQYDGQGTPKAASAAEAVSRSSSRPPRVVVGALSRSLARSAFSFWISALASATTRDQTALGV